jgi:hypothetical protein
MSNSEVIPPPLTPPASHRLVELIMLKGYGREQPSKPKIVPSLRIKISQKKTRRERSSMEAAAAGFGICLGIRRNRKKISIQFTVSVHVFFLFNDFLVLAPLHRSHFSLLLASSSHSRGRCYTLLNLHIISNQHPLTAASALLLPFS